MDFLLDNSRFARVKWLGRNSGQPGKSVYLSNFVSERPSLRPSVRPDGIAWILLRPDISGLMNAKKEDHPAFKNHRFHSEFGSILTASLRGDGKATEEPNNQSNNLKRKVT